MRMPEKRVYTHWDLGSGIWDLCTMAIVFQSVFPSIFSTELVYVKITERVRSYLHIEFVYS